MATITAGDFRNGKTFEYEGKIMQVVEFQHVKPGKGAAFVRTKMKNIVTGGVTETSFNPTAKFEEAFIDRKDMSYSYNDGDLYYFMDQETFDMVPLPYNKYYALDLFCRDEGYSHGEITYFADDYGTGGNDNCVYESDIDFVKVDKFSLLPQITEDYLYSLT